jgi:hypothetical protein
MISMIESIKQKIYFLIQFCMENGEHIMLYPVWVLWFLIYSFYQISQSDQLYRKKRFFSNPKISTSRRRFPSKSDNDFLFGWSRKDLFFLVRCWIAEIFSFLALCTWDSNDDTRSFFSWRDEREYPSKLNEVCQKQELTKESSDLTKELLMINPSRRIIISDAVLH